MAADKTIFECPVYSLYTQLTGFERMVIQPAVDSVQDYGVPLSLLAQWLFNNYQVEVTGGSTNPDPSAGQPGGIYFQTNGNIYQKIGGGWVLKANIVSGSPVFNGEIVNIFQGTTLTIDPDGRAYVDIDYAPFLTGHGNSPAIFVLQRIVNNAPTEEVNEIINDVPVRSLSSANVLNTLRVFPHVDPDDPTKSIDDIIILIK